MDGFLKTIELTKGKSAVVDDCDYEWLSQWKWHLGSGGYATRFSKKCDGLPRHNIFMHRLIMETPEGMEGDHINGDRLDNTRANLRSCLRHQNAINQKKRRGDYSSQYKGVCRFERTKKWVVFCSGKNIGYFKCEHDAATAYNFVAYKKYGEFAKMNEAA